MLQHFLPSLKTTKTKMLNQNIILRQQQAAHLLIRRPAVSQREVLLTLRCTVMLIMNLHKSYELATRFDIFIECFPIKSTIHISLVLIWKIGKIH